MSGLPSSEYLVVDIGGGSTEFVRGSDRVTRSLSVNVGTVRMTERHIRTDPPSLPELTAIGHDVSAAVSQALAYVGGGASTLIGVAGVATTVAGIALGLHGEDPGRVHHSVIAAGEIEAVTEQLSTMKREQRAAITVMHPGRVDVITAGAIILRETMRQTGYPEITISEHDILDGIVASLRAARSEGGTPWTPFSTTYTVTGGGGDEVGQRC